MEKSSDRIRAAAAVLAPLALLAGQAGVCGGALALLGALLCAWIGQKIRQGGESRRWLCAPRLALLLFAEAALSAQLALLWPQGDRAWLLALILLTLAAATCWAGREAASCTQRVLRWPVGILLCAFEAAAVLGGMADGRALPAAGRESWQLFALLLIPALQGGGIGGKQVRGWPFAAALAAFVLGAALVCFAKPGQSVFLTAVKGAEGIGTSLRLEGLCCCALTMGLYLALSELGTIAHRQLRALAAPNWTLLLFFALSYGVLLAGWQLPGVVYAAGATICWVILPLLLQGVERAGGNRKKTEKSEKNS